ncbi:MAG: GAF domain-containing protein [Candidatus Cloacimonetes bacterium]|nr:GAF domain-containing protein [Candidatus Cloacimonadota bacterium]
MDKRNRYQRIYEQYTELLTKTTNTFARMATLSALLHHKLENISWTGFYHLVEGELTVLSYQGPVACQILKGNTGVCWAAINQGKAQVVPNVHDFPGHIACDSRTNSEIVIPIIDLDNKVTAVLDIDSFEFNTFDEIDREELERLCKLIYIP